MIVLLETLRVAEDDVLFVVLPPHIHELDVDINGEADGLEPLLTARVFLHIIVIIIELVGILDCLYYSWIINGPSVRRYFKDYLDI